MTEKQSAAAVHVSYYFRMVCLCETLGSYEITLTNNVLDPYTVRHFCNCEFPQFASRNF